MYLESSYSRATAGSCSCKDFDVSLHWYNGRVEKKGERRDGRLKMIFFYRRGGGQGKDWYPSGYISLKRLRRRWCRRVSRPNGKGTRHQTGSRLGLLWDGRPDARGRWMEKSLGTDGCLLAGYEWVSTRLTFCCKPLHLSRLQVRADARLKGLRVGGDRSAFALQLALRCAGLEWRAGT